MILEIFYMKNMIRRQTMTDALYNLLYIIETIVSVVFQIGILYLLYSYIEVRKIKQ